MMIAKRWTEYSCLLSFGAAALMVAPIGQVAVAQDNNMASMVPDVAKRGIIRRQELVAKADEAALRGQRLMADKDYEGAVGEFQKALDLLPDAPVVEDRRVEYKQLFADSSVLLARQRAEEGRYTEAIELVEAILRPDVDPENDAARRLLEDLNDPEIYTPALTPEHIARVKRVEQALKVAASYIRLGDYNSAERSYQDVLNFDPYNQAARRGMEHLAREKRNYYDTAYDHMRSHQLTAIAEQWELKTPRFGIEELLPTDPGDFLDPGAESIAYIKDKLTKIIIPEIEFDDTPLSQAIEFLRTKSIELDDIEADPARKGVNIIIRTGGSGGGGGDFGAPAAGGMDLGFDDGGGGADLGLGGGGGGDDANISLKLSNVPLVEALRYTTELARLKYKVEPHAVVIIPITEVSEDLFTQVFRVPPGFTSAQGGDGGGGAPADPFADLDSGGGGGGGLERRKTAKEILEDNGITFPNGASAIYNATNSQLIVRNTQANLDLVEAYVDSLKVDVQKQIYITTKFVEIAQDDHDELGFDWLLGASNVPGSDSVFTSGGTVGTTRTQLDLIDYPFVPPGGATPVGTSPLTSANRFGNFAIDGNSIDTLLAATTAGGSDLSPGAIAIAGVFTDPQFQTVLRMISQHKGTDLLSAPSVMAKSGQRAKIEVIREFIYPSEYDPPEIPDNFGSIGTTNLGGVGSQSSVQSFPVVPANPAAFETRNVGVTLEVDPVIGADGFTIDLNLNPEVVEFEGFINYGSPIFTSGTDANGNPVQVQLTENRIEMPIFATRRVTTSVTIWDGQTVAVGGLIREDIQHVQDKLPLLGDIPGAGFLFRSEAEVHNKRNLTVFVTAKLVDPAGIAVNQEMSDPIQVLPPDAGL